MNNTPLVSVIIPTYNRKLQTIRAVESVLSQTYSNLEVIVIDDGSTDGSPSEIREFLNEKASKGYCISFDSQSNQGPSVARNAGVAKSRGEYIAFLDSDDIWLPEKIEWQLKAIERFQPECGACITDARLVNNAGMDKGSFETHGNHYSETIGIVENAAQFLAESFCGFWLSSLMVKAETIRAVGGFSGDILFAEDRDIQFRLSLVTKVAYVNRPLLKSDRTPSPPSSICRPWDRPEVQFQQQQRMLEKWLMMGSELPPDVRAIVQKSVGALYSYQTNWHLENARFREARQSVISAVKFRRAPGIFFKLVLTWFAPSLARLLAPKTRPIGSAGHAS